MSVMHQANVGNDSRDLQPSRSLVTLLAAGAGFSVASLYYSQPLLGVLESAMQADSKLLGLVPMLTQLGYAVGILLLAPLGDRFDRRKIILLKAMLLALTLFLSGFTPDVGWLLAGSLIIGLTATVAQDIVPSAAILSPDHSRGRTVGTVMTGLLLGILLSRVASGFIAETFGWRAVFWGAGVAETLIVLAVWRGLPSFPVATSLPYRALMRSLGQLWVDLKPLRKATLAQALLSVGFSAFWSVLALMLHKEFHLGSAAAGAFGLAGAAGALAAPLAGRLADKRGPEIVTRLGAALAALSFAAMALLPALTPHAQLWLICLSAIGFDFGVQATLVAHQTIVFGLKPEARSRLNAVMFTGIFIGMATGAALGSLAFSGWGWAGVVGLSTLAALLALAVRFIGR